MKKKVINIILLMIMMSLIVFGIFNLIKNEVKAAEGTNSKATKGVVAEGETDPNSYRYVTNFGEWEYQDYTHQGADNWYIPKRNDGYQIYCIEPDAHIHHSWELTKAEMKVETSKPALKNTGQKTCYKYGCIHGCIYSKEFPANLRYFQYNQEGIMSRIPTTIGSNKDGVYNGKQVYPKYTYEGTEFLRRSPVYWNPVQTTKLPPAMAYIVSDKPIGEWDREKQKAIWNLAGTGLDGGLVSPSASNKGGSSKFDNIAKKYAEYDEIVRKHEGLNPTDLSNIDEIKTKVDMDAREWIIGPFSVNYINGDYGDKIFSGISKIVAYDGKKEIKIKAIIVDGKRIEAGNIKYFEPNELKVDKDNQCIDLRGKKFQVVIDQNSVEDDVEKLSVKVKFQYMLANGEYTKYQGIKYTLEYSHSHPLVDKHPEGMKHHSYVGYPTYDENGHQNGFVHTCPGSSCYRMAYHECRSCEVYAYMKPWEQQPLIAVDAIRTIYEQEIELGPDGGVTITIDFEGKVWLDTKAGKESVLDGIFNGEDKLVEGVEVKLHRADNHSVVKTTKTGADGRYKFKPVTSKYKYYIEFRYNGQTYENTLYNVKGGDEIVKNYSYATESKSDRDAFNKNFAEINNADYKTGDEYEKYLYDDDKLTISAYTGEDGKNGLKTYPRYNKYVIGEKNVTVLGKEYKAIYKKSDSIKDLDFGIAERIKFDMALKKDVYMATVKINGKTEVYGYDKKNLEANAGSAGDTWDITVVGGYDRSINNSDYNFSGINGNKQLLEVYVTYKIAVRNQSMSMLGEVTKLTDYYDPTYEYKEELSWISAKNYTKSYLNKLQKQMANNKITEGTKPNATNQNGKVEVNIGKKQKSGETQYVYLTFKLKGEGSNVVLGEKQNKAEISAFRTYYKTGTILPHYGTNNYSVPDDNMIAGRFDKDSVPTNMGANGTPKQDDEDAAPGLKVYLTGNRTMNGTVWEDRRTDNIGNAIIGNGVRDNGEKGIAGVKVELVEKTVNNTEYVWKTVKTGSNGTYTFEGYIPGDYVVRFYYGDSADTVDIKNNGGISYNGQDFKSTIYQSGISQSANTDLDGYYHGYTNAPGQNETGSYRNGGYGYDIAASEGKLVSDAKDIWSLRERANAYSNKDVMNNKAEILASPYNNNSLMGDLIANTNMRAETGVIVVEVEKNMQSQQENGTPNYHLADIDLGLVERPKAQLEMDKSITNIKVTLADGRVLFDVNKAGDNVIWKDHQEYNLASKKSGNKYEEYYGQSNKNRYSYRTEVDKLVSNTDKGLVQLTMDEEIMHGATIEITYALKVTNVGEVDYTGTDFYYLGKNPTSGVKTSANQVIDYVANNLKFDSNNAINKQNGWNVISKDELNQGLIKSDIKDKVAQFNNIIATKALGAELPVGGSTQAQLVLTQLITKENTSDDLTYNNIAEIVKTSNTVGRRMAYSIVGNQDPTLSKASEVDASMAERVIILPPFGDTHIYYILGAVIAVILIGGIAFIIKKVLKK